MLSLVQKKRLRQTVRMLKNITISLFCAAGIAGTASAHAPVSWEVGSVWRMTIKDTAEKSPREITFEVESSPAKSCLSGDWKKLKVLTSSYRGVSEPAWSLKGRSVSVLITSDICDAYDEVSGKVSNGRFSGPHSQFGLGGSTAIGTVHAVRIK